MYPYSYNFFNFIPATHFGIALPKWIVEKQNSVWVSETVCKITSAFYTVL